MVVAAFALSAPAYAATLSASDIDAIGRVTYAEAGNEEDDGKAAVVFVILNRTASGQFGGSVQSVINSQFEPVMRAGGSWQNLPPMTEYRRGKIEAIINLISKKALPDISSGATYFQNPVTLADRARAGTVKPSLVGFNGMPRTASIGRHDFYSPVADEFRYAAPEPIKHDMGPTSFPDSSTEQTETVFLGK